MVLLCRGLGYQIDIVRKDMGDNTGKSIDVESEIRNIIADKLKLSTSVVDAIVTSKKDFTEAGVDSLDQVEMLMEVETHFGVEIADGDAEKITNLEKLIHYVKGKVESKHS